MHKNIKIIGFDADDTLWVNEPYYQETERKFCKLLESLLPIEMVSKELYSTEIQNLELYGYGAKGFVLSMLETALRISRNELPQSVVQKIVNLGKELLNKPIVLLDDVIRFCLADIFSIFDNIPLES